MTSKSSFETEEFLEIVPNAPTSDWAFSTQMKRKLEAIGLWLYRGILRIQMGTKKTRTIRIRKKAKVPSIHNVEGSHGELDASQIYRWKKKGKGKEAYILLDEVV